MNNRGYTLIEIIIALAVFAILLSAVINFMHPVSINDRIKSEASLMVAVIREARNRAFNGVIEPSINSYPLGGYGVYFKKDTIHYTWQYILFADKDGNNFYTAGEELSTYNLDGRVACTISRLDTITQFAVVFNGSKAPLFRDSPCTGSCTSYTLMPLGQGILLRLFAENTLCSGRIRFARTVDTGSLMIQDELVSC